MKLIIIIAFIVLPIQCSLGNPQKYTFSVIGNRIILHIDTLNFIFDTGANISLLDSTLARKIDLPFNNEFHLNTPGGVVSVISTNFSYSQFPGIEIIGLMPLDTIAQSLGCRVHGFIGAANVLVNNIIDINFKTEIISIYTNDVNPNICSGVEYELIANNNRINHESIGSAFPISPAIKLPLIFNKTDTIKTNLVIDTGCQFAFAFITKDSTIINSISKGEKEYTSLNGVTSTISYGKVSYEENNQCEFSFSPIFYAPSINNPINNNFFGLLGVPFLRKFERIVINWPKRKICFSN